MHLSHLDSLPPPPAPGDFAQVCARVAGSRTKIVVIDDDPTGTQTVHGMDILADWSVPSLAEALADSRPCFYILADTRSLGAAEAAGRVREISAHLAEAASVLGTPIEVISRSDSTLRGHFTEEIHAIEQGLGRPFDGKIVIPAFFEGGRLTVGNVHYVTEGEQLVPASQTEFARDRTFGYRSSNLKDWIEEKTGGVIRAGEVEAIEISTLRGPDGAGAVRRQLLGLPWGEFMVVNAAAYCDLEVFAHGLLQAEAEGKRYLLRTAASFVRVRAGMGPKPLLTAQDISSAGKDGGLVIVGSYTAKTTAQLEALLTLPSAAGIELAVGLLATPASREAEIARAAAAAVVALRAGRHAVVFTSREHQSATGTAGDLRAGRIVSDALVELVRRIPDRPRFLIAKGGITASDVAVRGLGMRRALVLGQASPGVPVWEMGGETRHPGMKYVVWPGNVGGADALRDLVSRA
jgi:uncharacterized protein YgbK (DUF1537 family)